MNVVIRWLLTVAALLFVYLYHRVGFALALLWSLLLGLGLLLVAGPLLIMLGRSVKKKNAAASATDPASIASSATTATAAATDAHAPPENLISPGQAHAESGKRVSFVPRGEIGMGGPVYGDYQLPGGLFVLGSYENGALSKDGRWFVASNHYSGNDCGFVLDCERRLLWQLRTWQQLGWQDNQLWMAPIQGGQPRRLQEVLEHDPQTPMDYLAIADLWLPRSFIETLPPVLLEPQRPAGAPPLSLHKRMPESLAALQDPLKPLNSTRYHLWLDNQDSGLLVLGEKDLCWRPDGNALAVRAISANSYDWTYHLWSEGRGWAEVRPWVAYLDEPTLVLGVPQSLSADTLRVEGMLMEHSRRGWPDSWKAVSGKLQAGEFYRGGGLHGKATIPGELTASMALRTREQPLRSFHVCLSLSSAERWLEYAGVRIVPTASSSDGQQGRYRYEGPGWTIDEALLEHRVSPDGRWWTTIAAAAAPALPQRLLALDTQHGRLHTLELPWPLLSLDSIADNELQAATLRGWVSEKKAEPDALRRCDVALSDPAQAVPFINTQAARGGLFWIHMQRIAIAPSGIEMLPDWRVPRGPVAANGAVDLLLPAPQGSDAAWLFGVDTSWHDGRLDPRTVRSGFLRTRSGLAMRDITPSLLWSEDGRYLLFLQWRNRWVYRSLKQDEWWLHAFDTHEHLLHRHPKPILQLPQLTEFRRGVIKLGLYRRDWIEPRDRPRPTKLPFAEIIAPGQRVALQEHQGLWLEKVELNHAKYWAAMAFPDPPG
ncbi:hypothetical protein [Dyella silvatica]|uniref:hypothetical protein n=1 Tax=Dyella silvatica TaxID=2992128 RepID=UPI002250DB13|nr:hypothetical protein [Dyella silvatica]